MQIVVKSRSELRVLTHTVFQGIQSKYAGLRVSSVFLGSSPHRTVALKLKLALIVLFYIPTAHCPLPSHHTPQAGPRSLVSPPPLAGSILSHLTSDPDISLPFPPPPPLFWFSVFLAPYRPCFSWLICCILKLLYP